MCRVLVSLLILKPFSRRIVNLLGIVVTPLKERTWADHFIDRWAEVTPQIALSSKGKVPNHNKTNGSITTACFR